jgi:hypothetical protein
VIDTNIVRNGSAFDHHISYDLDHYENDGAGKVLKWINGQPHCRHTERGIVRLNSLHCWFRWRDKMGLFMEQSKIEEPKQQETIIEETGLPKLGICTRGMELLFFQVLSDRCAKNKNGAITSYVELGFARGETFFPVCEWLRKETKGDFKAVAVDIEDGWSLDRSRMPLVPKNATISLLGSTGYLRTVLHESIDVLFIDGCHGEPCVTADFLAGEQKVKPGGFVIFHDTAIAAQGGGHINHCSSTLGVRAALKNLYLIDGRKRLRWMFYGEVPCVTDGPDTGSGGIMVFQKTR